MMKSNIGRHLASTVAQVQVYTHIQREGAGRQTDRSKGREGGRGRERQTWDGLLRSAGPDSESSGRVLACCKRAWRGVGLSLASALPDFRDLKVLQITEDRREVGRR